MATNNLKQNVEHFWGTIVENYEITLAYFRVTQIELIIISLILEHVSEQSLYRNSAYRLLEKELLDIFRTDSTQRW